MSYSIELDCSPGSPRPDTLITGVLEGTGLTTEDFKEPSTWFGNWTYHLKSEPHLEDKYEEAREVIKERVTDLYQRGRIRYGSW
jgi:hypothetical protein